MKKLLLILILIVTSCGYQPLYTNQDFQSFNFKEIKIVGNKKVNRKIISVLNFSENKSDYDYDELILDSKKDISITSRNDKGQATSYKQIIKTSITIKNNDNIIKQKNFVAEFSYNSKDNKFDLAELENQIKENLVDEIIEELIIYVNL